MSSVSSVGSNSDLYNWLQLSLTSQTAPNGTQAAAPAGQDPDGDGDGSGSSVQAAGHRHGHHGGGHGLLGKIESAVSSALQDPTSSGDATDPNQIIQNAIQSVLGGQPGQPGQPTDGVDTENDGDADDAANGATSASATNPQAAFQQLLQSFGVDPQQFQADFQSALQTAQSSGGSLDFSKLFQSFPPGSFVDTTA